MSLFSTIFKYSAAQLNYQSPVYHISYNTYEHTLPKIKPSLVPERTYNTLSDDIFNTLGDSNRDFLNTPYEITADTDYNSYVSKVIDKFAVKNTLRTLSHDANNDQQLIADYMPQQDLLLDLFKPNINLLAVDTGSNHGDQNNNIFTADSSLAHSENYFGYEGIDIFITEKPDTFFEISSSFITSEHITLKFPNQDPSSVSFLPELSYYLHDIERVQFGNKNLAFDLKDNAGTVAKVYGAVLGATSLSNAELIGSGLKVIDDGLNAENFATLALKSTGLESHSDIVSALWTNVVGSAPTVEQAQSYINMLDSGEKSIGDLVLFAADTSLNENNIDLVGLTSHGIEFA